MEYLHDLTSDFKTGMTILYEGNIISIEFLHVKPGKGQAFVRTKLRNLRTGAIVIILLMPVKRLNKHTLKRKDAICLFNK